jgi:hypothetical protein
MTPDELPGGQSSARRLGDLIGAPVHDRSGRRLGIVTDVRLAPGPGVAGGRAELVTAGLLVDRHRVGGLLGYDRRGRQGPLVVRLVVRYLHRHLRYLPWTDDLEIRWEPTVTIVSGVAPQPL